MTKAEREDVWERGVTCKYCPCPAIRNQFVDQRRRICRSCSNKRDWNSSTRRLARERTPEGKVQVLWRVRSWRRLQRIKAGKV